MERNIIICGDAYEVAKTLPDESLNCIITSRDNYDKIDIFEGGVKCVHEKT